jgi:hypothetical protein
MINSIKAAYPQIETNGCLQILTDSEFFVLDTEQKRCIFHTDAGSKKHFTVENPNEREIHFLSIDKCLFSDSESVQRCDFAVFDSKTFCFVEIKETTKAGKRSEYSRDAKDQLKATVRIFKQQMTFTTKRIEAYLCVGDLDPRPARLTNDLSEQFDFAELGAELYRGNIKRFGQ